MRRWAQEATEVRPVGDGARASPGHTHPGDSGRDAGRVTSLQGSERADGSTGPGGSRHRARMRRWQRWCGLKQAEREGTDCGRICRGKILRTASPRLLSAAKERPQQGRAFGN